MKKYIEKTQTYIKKHARIATIILFLGLASLGVAIGLSSSYDENHTIIANTPFWRTVAYVLVNIAPELAGIAVGFVTIDYLNEQRQDAQLKKQLVLQMGSRHNDVTDTAVRTLRAYGWLRDGTLKGAFFRGSTLHLASNLKNVDLSEADMVGVKLQKANLKKANLRGANLNKADLWSANLRWAWLEKANLEEARLWEANLRNARLQKSNMRRANLFSANLTEAKLWGADLEGAILQATNLEKADFLGANLKDVNLGSAKNWTREQLLRAKFLEGAVMPDGRLYEEWRLDDEGE